MRACMPTTFCQKQKKWFCVFYEQKVNGYGNTKNPNQVLIWNKMAQQIFVFIYKLLQANLPKTKTPEEIYRENRLN